MGARALVQQTPWPRSNADVVRAVVLGASRWSPIMRAARDDSRHGRARRGHPREALSSQCKVLIYRAYCWALQLHASAMRGWPAQGRPMTTEECGSSKTTASATRAVVLI